MHDHKILAIAAIGSICFLTGACIVRLIRDYARWDKEELNNAREAVDALIATLQADRDHHIALWEEEIAPQRPVYDWEVDGL